MRRRRGSTQLPRGKQRGDPTGGGMQTDFIVSVPKHIIFHVNKLLLNLKPLMSSSSSVYFGKKLPQHCLPLSLSSCIFGHAVKCFLSNLFLRLNERRMSQHNQLVLQRRNRFTFQPFRVFHYDSKLWNKLVLTMTRSEG